MNMPLDARTAGGTSEALTLASIDGIPGRLIDRDDLPRRHTAPAPEECRPDRRPALPAPSRTGQRGLHHHQGGEREWQLRSILRSHLIKACEDCVIATSPSGPDVVQSSSWGRHHSRQGTGISPCGSRLIVPGGPAYQKFGFLKLPGAENVWFGAWRGEGTGKVVFNRAGLLTSPRGQQRETHRNTQDRSDRHSVFH